MADLNEATSLLLRDYVTLLNHVAVLISRGLLDPNEARAVFGDTMVRCANNAKAFIDAERERGLPASNEDFASKLIAETAKWRQDQ